MTIRMYLQRLEGRSRARKRAITHAFARRVQDTMREVQRLLSGGISSKELARRGHPFGWGRGRYTWTSKRTGRQYARRRGARGSTPLLPINRQTRRLYNATRMKRRRSDNVHLWIDIVNVTPYAKFVLAEDGTRLMRPRGFVQALRRYTVQRRRRMYTEIASALRARR